MQLKKGISQQQAISKFCKFKGMSKRAIRMMFIVDIVAHKVHGLCIVAFRVYCITTVYRIL